VECTARVPRAAVIVGHDHGRERTAGVHHDRFTLVTVYDKGMARPDFVLRLAEVNTYYDPKKENKHILTTTTWETLRITCRALREKSAYIFTGERGKNV